MEKSRALEMVRNAQESYTKWDRERRQRMVLAKGSGATVREIAQVAGLSAGTVQKMLAGEREAS
jgi:predicted transcriptional regulator